MPRDKTAAHRKLMSAAREEFLAFGFEKAPMRSIGQRCGMTAAGIYRHCRSKEDLFDQLVSPAALRLGGWMREHEARYTDGFRDGQAAMWQDPWADMMRNVVYASHLISFSSTQTAWLERQALMASTAACTAGPERAQPMRIPASSGARLFPLCFITVPPF